MSSCSRSAEAVEYLLGLMDPALAESFLRHVEGCPACAAALEAERMIEAGLSCSYEVPEGLVERIGSSIDLLERPPKKWFALRLLGIAGFSSTALFALWNVTISSGRGLLAEDAFQQFTQSTARVLDSGTFTLLGLAFGICLTLATILALASRYGR